MLGVAPPRIDSTAGSPLRSPVLVRAGTAVADAELGSRPQAGSGAPPIARADGGPAAPVPGAPPASPEREGAARALDVLRRRPVLDMILVPLLFAAGAIAGLSAKRPARPPAAELVAPANSGGSALPGNADPRTSPSAPTLAELEAKPAESLSAAELVRVAEGATERKREAARALRQKVEEDPALGKQAPVRAELLQFASDARTAPEALAALAALEAPIGDDLLYEVWTGTAVRTDATELARALLYSKEGRAHASPALAVALDLRAADGCEQIRAILPAALKEGDRRSQPLLGKLASKRGCGPKKSEDCYACLRKMGDEVKATSSAVKSRRAPNYASP